MTKQPERATDLYRLTPAQYRELLYIQVGRGVQYFVKRNNSMKMRMLHSLANRGLLVCVNSVANNWETYEITPLGNQALAYSDQPHESLPNPLTEMEREEAYTMLKAIDSKMGAIATVAIRAYITKLEGGMK